MASPTFAFGLDITITDRDVSEGALTLGLLLSPIAVYVGLRMYLNSKAKRTNPARYSLNLYTYLFVMVMLSLLFLVSEDTEGGTNDLYKIFGWSSVVAGGFYLIQSLIVFVADTFALFRRKK